MNCKKTRKHLNLFVEGNLEDSAVTEVETHLKKCHGCTEEWRKTRKMFLYIKSIPAVKAPSYFEAQLNQRLEEQTSSVWYWITDTFSTFSYSRVPIAVISLCLVLITGAVIVFVQDQLPGNMATVSEMEDSKVISAPLQQKLADIGYINPDDKSFQFPEIDDDFSRYFDRVNQKGVSSTAGNIQPVNIVEVNF